MATRDKNGPVGTEPVRSEALEEALRCLHRWLAEESQRQSQPHLLLTPGTRIHLELDLPLLTPEADLRAEAAQLRDQAKAELLGLLAHRAVLRDGCVLDLRSGKADGPDCAPRDARAVFVGYAANGAPRFLDFAQFLLQHKHPGLDVLYQKKPGLVVVASSEDELYAAVLPPFRQAPAGWRLHGQVVVGFFEVERARGGPATLALTLQIQSAAGAGGRRRFALNLLGQGPDGEKLEAMVDRLGRKRGYTPPWRDAATWAQSALATLEQAAAAKGPRRLDDLALEERLHGILGGLARRLDHDQKARDRRTDHGELRHQQGDRPTPFAWRDLTQAADHEVLFDRRARTLIVLGDRGRAHVFNPEGKLITSIRYSPESIARKQKLEIWRPATATEIAQLRQAVASRGASREPNASKPESATERKTKPLTGAAEPAGLSRGPRDTPPSTNSNPGLSNPS